MVALPCDPQPGTDKGRNMNRGLRALALACAVGLMVVLAATAQARPMPRAESTLGPCIGATPSMFAVDLTGAAARGGDREPSAWKSPPIEEAPVSSHKGFSATIPVYFHVFTDGATGALTKQDLQTQVNVLNSDYAGFEGGAYTGSSFKYAGADYTSNA